MRIGKRGRVTIPKTLRDRFGLTPGVEVQVTATEEGILVRRSSGVHPVDRVSGILDGNWDFDGDIDEYIDEIRGRAM